MASRASSFFPNRCQLWHLYWTKLKEHIELLKLKHLLTEQHQTLNKWNRNGSTALGRPVIITEGLNQFYGTPTFTLIFRCGLHNLVDCQARMEGISSLMCRHGQQFKSTKRLWRSKDEDSTITTRWDTEIPETSTTGTPEHEKSTSWTPMGQEPNKCPAQPSKYLALCWGCHSLNPDPLACN